MGLLPAVPLSLRQSEGQAAVRVWPVLGVLLAASCGGEPERLKDPPPPSPACVPDWGVCEFPGECCSYARCYANQCQPIDELVPPDAGCTPDQVDIAIVLDLSDSMDPWIPEVALQLGAALESMPLTTSVQVWGTPHGRDRDGEYFEIFPRGSAAAARDAILLLEDGDGGAEATLDATSHLLRSSEHWRYGTTVRAIVVVSDEKPHSYYVPTTSMADVCDLSMPTDRVFAFTSGVVLPFWSECFDARGLSSLWLLPQLLIDPCEVGP